DYIIGRFYLHHIVNDGLRCKGDAGIRLGITFAPESIIDYMMKVKAPYNINKLTAQKTAGAFDSLDTISENISAIKEERSRLRKMLQMLPLVQKIYPSEANFLLAKVSNAKEIYEQLAAQAIIIRYRGHEPLCKNGLRITIG